MTTWRGSRPVRRARRRPFPCVLGWVVWAVVALMVRLPVARAQETQDEEAASLAPPRSARLEWDAGRHGLYLSVAFRDVLDDERLGKLRLGLPTTIILTGLLYAQGDPRPLASSLQNCKITWHVWEEMYRIEIVRPNHPGVRRHWTPTLNGVLRRCAEAQRLLVADGTQVARSGPLRFQAKVMVNPVSPELLKKIQRWISRPSNTSAAPPGSILFSTFTGLFMTRMGEAERLLRFSTRPTAPTIPPAEAAPPQN